MAGIISPVPTVGTNCKGEGMIFVAAANEPTMFLMLSEADVKQMREGKTKFVDPLHTGGIKFNKAIVSLHPTDDAAVAILKKVGGPNVPQVPNRQTAEGEERCGACDGYFSLGTTFEGKCITCWSAAAKAAQNPPAAATVRDTIHRELARLKDAVDQHEQTTHGLMTCGRLDAIGLYMNKAIETPNAHSASNLSQAIGQYLKGIGYKAETE